jgi:hypothetical protein
MDKTSTTEAKNRIQLFIKKGDAHLYFACHAAFPLAITPELLYSIREKFKQDIKGKVWNIPWITVADLLLSNLCKIEDENIELYKMDKGVRNLLIGDLHNANLGPKRIKELSVFLFHYAQQQLYSSDRKLRRLAEFQSWVALAYTRPDEAKDQITKALWKAYEPKNLEELEGIESLLEDLAENLVEFEPLLGRARRLNSLAHGNFKDMDDLRSERDINYTPLRDFLIAGDWKKADEETNNVLLKAAGRQEKGWLNLKSIKEFPPQDIQTIDKLWVKYSDGHFGFSVQQLIWQEIKGMQDADYIIWCCFSNKLKWRIQLNWLLWENLTFTRTEHNKGQLPALALWSFIWYDNWQLWRNGLVELEEFYSIVAKYCI